MLTNISILVQKCSRRVNNNYSVKYKYTRLGILNVLWITEHNTTIYYDYNLIVVKDF